MKDVLVINSDLKPISIVHWTKAITMCILDRAEVYKETKQVIRSQNIKLTLPSIIKLKKYRYIKYTPKLSRLNILLRDNHQCQYCGKKVSTKSATLDHVIPKSKGGKKEWKNIVTCCLDCNRKKKDLTLDEINFKLLNKPKQLFSVKYNISEWGSK